MRKFSDLKIPLIYSEVDLNSGEDVLFKDNNLLNAVFASSTIPEFILFKHKLIDGAVSRPILGKC